MYAGLLIKESLSDERVLDLIEITAFEIFFLWILRELIHRRRRIWQTS